MFSLPFRILPRVTYAMVIVALVAVVGSMSPASAADSSVVPATSVFRMGSDSWSQTHLPQYTTVFLGAYRTTDLDYIRSHSATTRVLMYKNAIYLADTCGNPTPVACQTAVSYAEALAQLLKRERQAATTGRLNDIYSRQPAKLDPALHRAQLKSMDKDSW